MENSIGLMKSSPRHQYQEETRQFIARNNLAGLFVYYGGGKTYLTIQWLADVIERDQNPLPAIVMCPKNLVHQWGKQIEEHSNFTYSIVEGSLRERKIALGQKVDIYIVNYGAMRTQLRFMLNELAAISNTIISDESTYLKNSQTLRFKLIQYNFKTIPHRAILTGRPITEKPEDLWSQMLFLDQGHRLGRSYWHYMNEYFENDMWVPYKKVLKPGAAERIADKVKDICVYVPKEKVAAQLPPQTIIPIKFSLPASVRKQYDELKRNFRLEFESGSEIDTQWAVVKAAKLMQMCQGFVYAEDGTERVVERIDTDKLDWLEDSLPQILAQGPMIAWGYHRQTVMDICDVMAKLKIKYGRYIGGDDESDIDKFKNGDLDALALSIPAAYSGYNLFRAKSAIFVSHSPSGDHRENALHRNYRLGSEMHDQVIVYDLIVDNSVEEAIYKAPAEKISISDSILKYLVSE